MQVENRQTRIEIEEKVRNILASYCAHEENGLLHNQYYKFTPSITDVPVEVPFGCQNKLIFTDVHTPGVNFVLYFYHENYFK